MDGLEFCTNEDLIAELLRRSTFRGVILRQREDYKGTVRDAWRWDAANMDLAAVAAVVGDFLPQIREQGESE